MKCTHLLAFFLFIATSTAAQFKNIKLAEQREGDRYQPCEPSIAINLENTNNIVAGIVLDRAIYTEDGGATWQEKTVTSPFGVYGDPAVVSDTDGNFYFFHLADPSGKGRSNEAWLDRIVVNKSKDGGASWNDGVSIGHNPPKDQDKQWPTVNLKNNNLYVTWTQFDAYGSKDPSCQSNILFSKSTNKGEKWSKPVVLSQTAGDCIDDDNTTEGAVPATTYDGKVFVAWSNQGMIFFDRSYDGGDTWLRNDIAIFEHPGGWAMDIPGISRCNGMPVLVCDNSKSAHTGMLYLVWADQRNGESDTDIWFSRSNNYGDNWTIPTRINDDAPGKHQFLPWLAIDQTTGYLYVVFYDRRAHEDTTTDVYLAYSTDAGQTFTNVKISEAPFVPDASVFFGDYNNIAAHAGVIAPIWTRMDTGKTSVMTTIIKQDALLPPVGDKKKKKK
jgi:hypothetical protein